MLVNIHFQKYNRKQYILDTSGFSRCAPTNWTPGRGQKKVVCDMYINFG